MELIKIDEIISQPITQVSEPTFTPPPEILTDQPGQQIASPQTVEQEPEETEGNIPLDPEETADLIIELLDTGQQWIYPKLYENALFSKSEKAILRELNNKLLDKEISVKKGEDTDPLKIEFTVTERTLLRKTKELEIYETEIVPLDERDKNLLRKPLIKILQNANVEMSPGAALSFAIIVISVTRALPLIGAAKNKSK